MSAGPLARAKLRVVSTRIPAVEETLRDLQRLVRRPPDGGQTAVMTRRLPDDLITSESRYLGLLADEVEAVGSATSALAADPRFEHLDHADDAVWRFVAECWADRSTDHVPVFLTRNAAEVEHAACYIPIEFLTVESRTQLPGLVLLPVDDPQVPPANPRYKLDQPTGCVAVVEVDGSSYGPMAERAGERVAQVLRSLRIALGGHVHPWQLRFRPGIGYSFGGRLTGWKRHDDEAYSLTLATDISDLLSHPAMALLEPPRNDVERKARLAMQWMERAYLAGDELIALLYRFFALEALLGDKSEGLKAHGLAFREMMLSHIISGGFRHPSRTYFFYDQVRSAAVHGEEAPDISPKDARNFEWAVRDALCNYLKLADDRGISRRGKLLQVLDHHPDRPQLIAWLRQYGGPVWTSYLDKQEGSA
jgi:hypothetical protein